jgi:uncharacterized membrane-anchored protein
VGSVVADGAALVATDFGIDPRGFVRILVADRGLSAGQAGSLVQRLLEIETYRCFALLGLPEAQALSPRIRRIELALAEILNDMGSSEGYEVNKRLLDRLTALAAELEADAVGSLYRFGATRAYSEIVTARLAALEERPVTGIPTWSDFLSRRLDPAMRTCASAEERQTSLSRKLARAAQLLRTRVDLELGLQNRTLLAAMNERARTQLRLQQTVEAFRSRRSPITWRASRIWCSRASTRPARRSTRRSARPCSPRSSSSGWHGSCAACAGITRWIEGARATLIKSIVIMSAIGFPNSLRQGSGLRP